jgi:hypothetical protein
VLEAEAADAFPIAEHVVPVPIVIPAGPVNAGLSPGDASSVAPIGRPTGGTEEPGVMPSGVVAPMLGIGLPIPSVCARARLHPNGAATIMAINARLIATSIVWLDDPAGLSVPPHPISSLSWCRPDHLENASSSHQNA